MTEHNDNTAPVTGAETPADGLNSATEGGDTGGQENDAQTGKNPNAEAAKYRVRAREAEQTRDRLARMVKTLQTREVERVASKYLAEPADLFTLTGKTVADFSGTDGELDAEAVVRAANELLGVRPGLGKNAPAIDPSQGKGGTGKTPPKTPSWNNLFHGENE